MDETLEHIPDSIARGEGEMATLAVCIKWGTVTRVRVGGVEGERGQGSRQYGQNGTGTSLFVIILSTLFFQRTDWVYVIDKTGCVPSVVVGSGDI